MTEWMNAIKNFHMCAVTPGGANALKKKVVVEDDSDDLDTDNQNE
jgi:hypothetical protein